MPPQGRLGDKSQAPVDAHGCPACPHPVIGPAIQGSPNVLVNGRPALRLGDQGVHAPCCGPNMWTAVKGSATVLINNMPAHRMGDTDMHCGGVGQLIEGSPDVIVGDATAAAVVGVVPMDKVGPLQPTEDEQEQTWIGITLRDFDGTPIANESFQVTLDDGTLLSGTTDADGYAKFDGLSPGQGEVAFVNIPGDKEKHIPARPGVSDDAKEKPVRSDTEPSTSVSDDLELERSIEDNDELF